ncbi:MAG: hypothetical protein APF80_07560 [Alphaproteobacteria bacterium BRH_c36]|nr:MAG: hypothetical protein APF80_07560 [Alphaproteobacteria bacterium BRH_c36]
MRSAGAWQNRAVAAGALSLAVAAAPGPLFAEGDPKVPHGLDPGGVAIALISDGVDYTDPEIASRLARDGEGEPIALDLVDGDVRPYAPAGSGRGTELAKRLLATYRNGRLVLVRADPNDAQSLARAAMFVMRTPSRVAAVAFWGHTKDTWESFSQVAQQSANVLFVVPGGDVSARSTGTNFPAQLKIDNVVSAVPFAPPRDQYAPAVGDEKIDAWVVAPGSTMFGGGPTPGPRDSVEAAILLASQAGCSLEGNFGAELAETGNLKAALMAQARLITVNGISANVHDPLCWYGGIQFGEPGRF